MSLKAVMVVSRERNKEDKQEGGRDRLCEGSEGKKV